MLKFKNNTCIFRKEKSEKKVLVSQEENYFIDS